MDLMMYTQQEIPAIMTVPQLANFLHIGRNQAYQLIRSNKLEIIRIGKQIRIPRHSVLRYLGITDLQTSA